MRVCAQFVNSQAPQLGPAALAVCTSTERWEAGDSPKARSQIRMPFQTQALVRFPDVVQRGIARHLAELRSVSAGMNQRVSHFIAERVHQHDALLAVSVRCRCGCSAHGCTQSPRHTPQSLESPTVPCGHAVYLNTSRVSAPCWDAKGGKGGKGCQLVVKVVFCVFGCFLYFLEVVY